MPSNWALVIFVPIIISGVFTFAFTDQLATARPVFATSTVEGVVGTSITLKVSKRVIFVGENFSVHGVLEQYQGIVMGAQKVRLSWATNRSIILTTNWDGSFAANISFPAGFRQGFTNITANFAGDDQYVPSSSFLPVDVIYRPSTITAEIVPETARPLDHVDVTGTLLGSGNQSLSNRTIAIKLDETVLGNAITNTTGAFAFSFNVPEKMSNGTHSLAVFFNPTHDLFAPSNTTLPFFVEPRTTATTTAPTPTATTTGTAATATTTTAGSEANVIVPILTAVAVAVISFSLVFKLKKRASPIPRPPQEPAPNNSSPIPIARVSETEAIESSPKTSLDELVSRLNLEKNPAAKITLTYYLAQDLITERLGLAPEKNETDWEYFDRVTRNATYIKEPLREIVQLFELTKYATNPCDATQSSQATATLLRLAKEIENRTTQVKQPPPHSTISEPDYKICRHCGAKVRADKLICDKCGMPADLYPH